MSDSVRRDPILDAVVRAGDPSSQGASTYRLAAAAVGEGRFEQAEELGRFTVEEARESLELYPGFVTRAIDFMLQEGVPPETVRSEERRVLSLLTLPDGTPFDLQRGWSAYLASIEAFREACRRGASAEALRALEEARLEWQRTQDRACDWVYGVLDVCARVLGEDRVGEAWDHMLAPLYPTRRKYDVAVRPWAELVEPLIVDAATSLRGHLSGPDRWGDVEIEEEEDRWILRFDPCGSGGRTYRSEGDGTPPRMEPPYSFAVTTRKHDWAWNKEGICLYCAHCCLLQQRAPIRMLGYPVRVVEPPRWPSEAGAKCTWSVYKDPSLVPDEAYRQVGERPPGSVDE